VLHPFAVISGGPGTGKTTTVARILSLLLEQPALQPLRISLSAPTGKAAARLTASIQAVKAAMPCSERVRAMIPEQATTVHRLLQAVPGSAAYRYDRRNPLPTDVVVVDEASMVDVALMSHLVQALAPEGRLLLVGDRDQLASVEAGSVLGDICHKQQSLEFSASFSAQVGSLTGIRPDLLRQDRPDAREPGKLADSIVVLRRSYRFDDRGGIGRLARCVNMGDAGAVFERLSDPNDPSIRWQKTEADGAFPAWLAKQVVKGYRDYLSARQPAVAIERFERFKILCAVRAGPFGVDAVNGLARRALQGANLIMPEGAAGGPWYAGRPVLITRNDYETGLFNGDMGIALPDPEAETDRLFVFFPNLPGSPKRFEPLHLPAHETAFAMTVHKSQGSEFDDVLLVLPDRDSPLLTRELVYTAVTRARRSVTLLGRKSILSAALSRSIVRTSGLEEGLWGKDSEI
jgi:exodeoxyribonuclease V alpha subunit